MIAEQIQDLLTKFSKFNSQNALSRDQLISILNGLSQQNGHMQFSNEIAQELFNRIEYYQKKVLCIQTLSDVFVEADDALNLKINYMQDQEDLLFDSLEQLKNIQQETQDPRYQRQIPKEIKGINYILIDDVQLQLNDLSVLQKNQTYQDVGEPYVVIRMGLFIYESEIARVDVGINYRFQIKVKIPIESFMDDLVIQVVDRTRNSGQINDYGQILLTVESLPIDGLQQAPFQLIKRQSLTANNLILSCQMILGNQILSNQFIEEKQLNNQEKLTLVTAELRTYNEQQSEIRKFFQPQKLQIPDTSKQYQQTSHQIDIYNDQSQYSNRQQQRQQLTNGQENNQNRQSLEQQNLEMRGYENPYQYQREYYNDELVSQQQSNQQPQQNDLFSVNTLDQQSHYNYGPPVQKQRPSKQSQAWQQTRNQQKLFGNNDNMSFEEGLLSRTDIIAIALAFSLIFQTKRSDFLGISILLFLIMSVMLKRFYLRSHILILGCIIVFSFASDCFWLKVHLHVWEKKIIYDTMAEPKSYRQFTIIMIILGMILKILLGISTGVLLIPANLSHLKRNFLRF